MSCSDGTAVNGAVDAAVHERIERERVVRAGREAEGDVHGRSISAITSAVTRASSANASSKRQSARSVSSIAFETTRSSSAGTPSSRQAASTAWPSIASTSTSARAADVRARADRQRERLRQRAPRRRQEPCGGFDRLAVAVAVDRLGAEHGCEQRDARGAPRARDADVQDGRRAALGDGILGRRVGGPGPMPQTSVRAPATPASSFSVAAITSNTRAL